MRRYLRTLRNNRNLTQEDAARRTGMSAAWYSAVERGTKLEDITLSAMQKLADAFNVNIDVIFEFEKELLNKTDK